MKVYIVGRWEWNHQQTICGVFSSYELADNYVNVFLSNVENRFIKSYIHEYVIDHVDE
jgi:hypothetical protein